MLDPSRLVPVLPPNQGLPDLRARLRRRGAGTATPRLTSHRIGKPLKDLVLLKLEKGGVPSTWRRPSVTKKPAHLLRAPLSTKGSSV